MGHYLSLFPKNTPTTSQCSSNTMAFLTRSSSEYSFGRWLEMQQEQEDFFSEYDAGMYGPLVPPPSPETPVQEEEEPTFPLLGSSPVLPVLPPPTGLFEEEAAPGQLLWAGNFPLQIQALTPVEAVRQRLYNLGPQENLDNSELAVVADNIYAFSQEDLMNIPNVYIRGNTHYPLQMAREVMTAVKMASTLGGCSLHQILPPFLTEDHCQCYCTVKAASGMMCSRKRRIGETTCSRHVAVTGESVPAYVLKMNASKLARMGEPVV